MKLTSLVFVVTTVSSRIYVSSWWVKRRLKPLSRWLLLPKPIDIVLDRAPAGNVTYLQSEDNIINDTMVWNSLGTPIRSLATTPYSWEQLIDICRVRKDLSLHSRSFQDQRNYLLFKRNVLDRYWTSIHDYILCDKFQFERRLVRVDHRNHTALFEKSHDTSSRDGHDDDNDNPSLIIGYFKEENILEKSTEFKYTSILRSPPGFRFCAYPPLESWPKGKIRKCLAMNDFPYFVQSGIEHWCLWKIGGDVTREDIDEALIILQKQGKEGSLKRTLIDSLSFVNPPSLKSVKAIDHAHILCLWETDSSSIQ